MQGILGPTNGRGARGLPYIGDHSVGRYAGSASVQHAVDDTTTPRNWSRRLGMYGDLVPVDTLYDLVIARAAEQHY